MRRDAGLTLVALLRHLSAVALRDMLHCRRTLVANGEEPTLGGSRGGHLQS